MANKTRQMSENSLLVKAMALSAIAAIEELKVKQATSSKLTQVHKRATDEKSALADVKTGILQDQQENNAAMIAQFGQSKATKAGQIATDDPADAEATYDQTQMQEVIDLLKEIKSLLNVMN